MAKLKKSNLTFKLHIQLNYNDVKIWNKIFIDTNYYFKSAHTITYVRQLT